ncbi:MAG TPA: hypothetical protein VGF40_01455 [Thermoanaerobaculia bacterium]
MTRMEVPLPLSNEENELIAIWRELPAGPMQRRVREIVVELLRFARDPHCDEMQGDGVPCTQPRTRCDECARVIEILRRFETRVTPPAPAVSAEPGLEIETEAW